MESSCKNYTFPLAGFVHGSIKEKKAAGEVSILRGPLRLCQKPLPAILIENLQVHIENTAVIGTSGLRTTYKKILECSMELSLFLREICHLPTQSRIGLLLQNSVESVECILASMFSGLVYVPLDSADPKQRLEYICNESNIKAIVFEGSNIGMANHLHWACASVESITCVDSQIFLAIQDVVENSLLMDVELWNCVARKAKDDIESGEWKSSYTGEYMSIKEMEEYAENILMKLKDHIKPTTRVLDIGCATGPTVQKLCPLVGHYLATDFSESMTIRLQDELSKNAVTNAQVLCMSADQVGHRLQGRKFDVIIMNSVVHCFPGHNYLRAVFQVCEKLLDKDGVIFVGDIMDLDLREELVLSLKSFKKAHPKSRVKTNWENELFLSRAFIQHLCDSSQLLKSVQMSRKHYTLANELTEFRFDALFTTTTTTSECLQPLNQTLQKQIFALEDISEAAGDKGKQKLREIVFDWAHDVRLEDEAYVLYTSGTTGTPKGVIIGHEALANYVTWATKTYQFDSNSVTPYFGPLTFDFTITSILPPLLGGSVIRVFKPFQDSYQALANSTEITVAKYSPLQLDTVLSASNRVLNASIFILGGEELTPSLMNKLKKNKRNYPFVVWNEYGPTEATVGCVARCFTSDELPIQESTLIPIGKPIDNVTVAVVQNQGDPVPQGARGRLAIGGKCLCLDFAGSDVARDAKRSESFIASCWGILGQQMLMTEDSVQLVPTCGELVYLGRDRESEATKVNGIRLDLMEIQRMIESDPIVSSAWASTFTHKGRNLLGAAVKLEEVYMPNGKCGDVTWKQHLMRSLAPVLPLRSIPKVLVQLSAAPTNKNGKKDVDYLQNIFIAEMVAGKESIVTNASSSGSYRIFEEIFPSTPKLQRIWQNILSIDHLPMPKEDFFFDLSGDSFLAIHLVRKMRDEGFQVSVTDIFQYPSIEKLVAILEKREDETTND